MPPPVYTPEDYLAQFQRLLPRGRVWHRGWGLVQDADLLALMPMWARLQARVNDLIGQIFPCSTTELLPEWEETLGLPDECTGPLATTEQRTAAVCGKFAGRGGSSRAYFIHLAISLGFEVTIEEYVPFTASRSRAGDRVYDEKWAWAWKIVAAPVQVQYFLAGHWTAGDPLATWGNKLLQCEIERVKPAWTQVVWSYVLSSSRWDNTASVWDDGESIWDQGIIIDQPN